MAPPASGEPGPRRRRSRGRRAPRGAARRQGAAPARGSAAPPPPPPAAAGSRSSRARRCAPAHLADLCARRGQASARDGGAPRRLSSAGRPDAAELGGGCRGGQNRRVVALQLTQPPTRDVSVTVTASQPEQLLFALESDALAAPSGDRDRAKDALAVARGEGARRRRRARGGTARVARRARRRLARHPADGSAVEPLRASVLDNDVAAVIISDPREAPQTREMVCDGEVPESVLSYSTTEDVPVDALVWLAGAPSDGDDVTVTLRSGDPRVDGGDRRSDRRRRQAGGSDVQPDQLRHAGSRETHTRVRSDVADPDRVVDLVVDVSSSSAPYAAISVPDIPVTIADLQTPGVAFSRVKIRERAGARRRHDAPRVGAPRERRRGLRADPRPRRVARVRVAGDPAGVGDVPAGGVRHGEGGDLRHGRRRHVLRRCRVRRRRRLLLRRRRGVRQPPSARSVRGGAGGRPGTGLDRRGRLRARAARGAGGRPDAAPALVRERFQTLRPRSAPPAG